MATFHEKISNEEIAAIRRVMRDCLQQTRAASCHNVVRELSGAALIQRLLCGRVCDA